MPSGITSEIYDDKDETLGGYLNKVARSLGMAIHQRDESFTAPLRKDAPSTYHSNALVNAQLRLKELQALTVEEAEAQATEAHTLSVMSNEESKAKREALKKRYEDMLAQVEKWDCPEEISYVKENAIRYLVESIDFDCTPYDWVVEKKDGKTWLADEIEHAKRDIDRHNEGQLEELERITARNQAIELFLEAVPE